MQHDVSHWSALWTGPSVFGEPPELECLWPLGPDYILWKVTLQSLVQRRACEMLENFLENWTILQHSTLWSTVAICNSGQQYGSYGSVEIYQHPRRKFLALCENMFGDMHMSLIFMHDNAPCHKARTVDRLLDEKIQTMQWPPQSPTPNHNPRRQSYRACVVRHIQRHPEGASSVSSWSNTVCSVPRLCTLYCPGWQWLWSDPEAIWSMLSHQKLLSYLLKSNLIF
jgi:hypothetical protein